MSTPSLFPPERPTVSLSGRKIPVKQIAITLACGVLLAFGSCVGFLGALNANGPRNVLSAFCAVLFFVGVAAVLIGSIWALVALFLYFFSAEMEKYK